MTLDSGPTPEQRNQPPSRAELKIRDGEKVTLLRVGDFNALFSDIASFNNQFSLRSMIGSMMSGIIERYLGASEDTTSLSKYDEQFQQLTASGIGLIHSETLYKVGLTLESVSGKADSIIAQDEKVGTGELRINISDRNRFLGFLQSVDPPMTNNSPLGENLQNLSNILALQIFDNYNLKEPNDEALQLLGSLEKVVFQFHRLEIPGTERLESYSAHANKGDLIEYVLVEQEGLLKEPGKFFGPADWQKDANPDYLRRRWEDALKILEMARINPKARDIYNQLFSHLDKCLDIAISSLENLDESKGTVYNNEYKNRLVPILQKIKQAFG